MKLTPKILRLFLSIIFAFSISLEAKYIIEETDNALKITMEYGTLELDKNKPEDLLLINIIKHPAFKALKERQQYGPTHYFKSEEVYGAQYQFGYTRFEHSIGVFVLLRIKGANLIEQVAGLLHDITHLPFSHAADEYADPETIPLPYRNLKQLSYQDRNFIPFINKTGIAVLLKKAGISPEQVWIYKIVDGRPTYNLPAVKQKVHDVCADCLDYVMKGALLSGALKAKLEDIKLILTHLKLDAKSRCWYFTSEEAALKFGKASIKTSTQNSGSEWNILLYKLFAKAILHAKEKGLITIDELLYTGDDNSIFNKMFVDKHNDAYLDGLKYLMDNLKPKKAYRRESKEEKGAILMKGKARIFDPILLEGNISLTQKNELFRQKFYSAKQQTEKQFIILLNGFKSKLISLISLEELTGQ